MSIWIEGARPKTLIASISPVLIGSVIAFKGGAFRLPVFLGALLFALLIQVGTNFANDYIDFLKGADTKERKGPRRLVQAGLVSPEKMRRVTFGVFACAGLIGIYLMWIGGWQIGLLALCAILFGYLYTGGSFPLGYLGLGDLFVLVFFGPVATAGVFYLHTGVISSVSILAGFPPGLLSTAILVMNNLRDVEQDKKAQKKTLPVRFGKGFGKGEFAGCILLSSLFPLATFEGWAPLTSVATLGMGLPLIRAVYQGDDYGPLLSKVGKVLTLYTLIFTVGYLL